MAHFAAEHASALEDIRANGASVVFTLATSSYNQSTDVESSASTVSVTGAAIRTKGKTRNTDGSLVKAVSVTLLFAPDTYGERPDLNATVTWEGDTYTVVDVDPVAPDGTDILSRVGLA
jgi:hypothetical protein